MEKTANPAVLGLLGYGMTTVLLSLANSGIIPFDGMIIAMALFFGGAAQTLVASMLFKLGDTFGVVAFGGYSFLWLSFGLINLGAFIEWWTVSSAAIGFYLIIWMIFTIFLVFASMVAPRVLTIILMLTVVLLGSLAIGNLTGNAALVTFGGYEGILTGGLAMYMAFAVLLNEMWGKQVLPLGTPFRSASNANA
ncbi:MAG: acetate uptake transporter [Rhodoluna sp.]|jgi:succinate-acetate transporter protein